MELEVTQEKKATEVGSYFVSNYPPYSVWSPEHVPAAVTALDTPVERRCAEGGSVSPPLGLYLHIPFCRKRCEFCYFRVYTDKNAREIDWDGFSAAQDAALAVLGSSAAADVRDFISGNFETDTVTAMRKIADGVTDETTRRSGFTYYERDVGTERLDFRKAHPDTDARLFIIGATISVLGARAQKRASALLQQWFGITVRWQDIPKRETTGGVRF